MNCHQQKVSGTLSLQLSKETLCRAFKEPDMNPGQIIAG